MAKEPDNVVLMLLREIRAVQDEHSGRLERMEKRLDDVHEGMITSLGLAGHAHVRHDSMEKRLDELTKRVERLEKKK
jgi:hypothetical protein